MSDRCARCGDHVDAIASYRTSTSRMVERVCKTHGLELERDERIHVEWIPHRLLEGVVDE